MSNIGACAKSLRIKRGEAQETVARRAGIALTTYSRIENGHNEPSLDSLMRIAAALDVTAAELLNTEPVAEGAA